MKSIETLLHDHPFTTGLDHALVTLIAGCAKNMRFDPGDYLLREGEVATHFHLIREGTVALELFAPGKGPRTVLTLKRGELVGASWLVPPYTWSFDARAVETTRVLAFDCTCLRDKCEADHHLGYEMMKRFIPPLVERLQIARMQCADLYGEPLGIEWE